MNTDISRLLWDDCRICNDRSAVDCDSHWLLVTLLYAGCSQNLTCKKSGLSFSNCLKIGWLNKTDRSIIMGGINSNCCCCRSRVHLVALLCALKVIVSMILSLSPLPSHLKEVISSLDRVLLYVAGVLVIWWDQHIFLDHQKGTSQCIHTDLAPYHLAMRELWMIDRCVSLRLLFVYSVNCSFSLFLRCTITFL